MDFGFGGQANYVGELPRGRSIRRHLLRKRDLRPVDRYHKNGIVLDQGASASASAYALWHWLVLHDRGFVGISPESLAELAGWAGLASVPTPSVRELLKALHGAGLSVAGFWTRSAVDVRQALRQGLGPVLLTARWSAGMLAPDRNGFVLPRGRIMGRHTVVIVGYDTTRAAFRLLNSFGKSWGQLGRAWVAAADLQALLRDGEACVPVVADDEANVAERVQFAYQQLQPRW